MDAETFFVDEVLNLEKGEGDYLYICVKKKNRNTLDVVNELARQAHIPKKSIGFAGIKDKHATTTQHMSVYKASEHALKKVSIDQVEITVLGKGKEPVILGKLEGNKFRIKIDFQKIVNPGFMVNYFGPQRFSTSNAEIGRFFIKKEWEKAISLMNNEKVNAYLAEHPTDRIGALRQLDQKVFSLYLHAFQSYLWNQIACSYLKEQYRQYTEYKGLIFVREKQEEIMIPLPAFDAVFQNKEVEHIALRYLQMEGITVRDFIIRSFPDSLPVAHDRPLFVPIKGFAYEEGWLSFFLPAGSYATVFLAQLESFL